MSTGRLRKEDFEPLAPDDVGNIRVNHDSSDCAGSSKSMVVRDSLVALSTSLPSLVPQ
jgi:hypothetical protein